jgi:tRNA(fMet)-specific endonuclease VapC
VYLLDTTVWVDLLRTNSPAIRRKLVMHSGSRIGLSIVTLCELRYGLERRAIRHPHPRSREQHLLSAIVAPFDIFPLDERVSDSYGQVRASLESTGRAMGALDTFIAAQALSLKATLVTSNVKEFRHVSGLSVEDWR